jgi:hypothetical protein
LNIFTFLARKSVLATPLVSIFLRDVWIPTKSYNDSYFTTLERAETLKIKIIFLLGYEMDEHH